MEAFLQFLKLGGSLITEKTRPHTPRLAVIERLADEIAAARDAAPQVRLLLGHGSGSYGHIPARQYGTRQGVRTEEQWRGFVEVWKEAAALNRLVVDALHAAGLPAVSLPASAAVRAEAGRLAQWDLTPIIRALDAGLLPVIYGDVAFDEVLGGTILSTEDLFSYLAPVLRPQRLLLAGLEAGVWADFPVCTRLLEEITPANYASVAPALGGSAAPDVTGGMMAKVQEALAWVQAVRGLDVRIFSGDHPGAVREALLNQAIGTRIWQG